MWDPATFVLTIDERRRPCYGQLTAVRKGYPLTSITRPYRVLRFQLIKGLNPGNVFFLGHFSLTSYKLLVNLRLKFNFFFQQQLFLVFCAPPSTSYGTVLSSLFKVNYNCDGSFIFRLTFGTNTSNSVTLVQTITQEDAIA